MIFFEFLQKNGLPEAIYEENEKSKYLSNFYNINEEICRKKIEKKCLTKKKLFEIVSLWIKGT